MYKGNRGGDQRRTQTAVDLGFVSTLGGVHPAAEVAAPSALAPLGHSFSDPLKDKNLPDDETEKKQKKCATIYSNKMRNHFLYRELVVFLPFR